MAGTYTQILIHLVFSTYRRQRWITNASREEIQMIMSGIVRNRKQKPIAVYCMPDHAHLLVGLNGIVSISDLVRDVKAGSSNLINEKRMFPFKFQWQSGYGAFSHSNRDLQKLVGYVLGQEKHHAKLGIEQEFISLLEEHHIPYDLRWVFG